MVEGLGLGVLLVVGMLLVGMGRHQVMLTVLLRLVRGARMGMVGRLVGMDPLGLGMVGMVDRGVVVHIIGSQVRHCV